MTTRTRKFKRLFCTETKAKSKILIFKKQVQLKSINKSMFKNSFNLYFGFLLKLNMI